jgi:hypothetical protein
MTSKAHTPDEYVETVDDARRPAFSLLREAILNHLPDGFEETMSYGMIGYVVPHSIYPKGYHCDPKLPLPFVALAAQKNALTFYHMGIYADESLMLWFTEEYPKHCKQKLDMGKNCVRFKKTGDIPYALISQLMQKVSVADWIERYERSFRH